MNGPLEVSTISSSSTPDDGPRKEETAPPPKQKTQQGVSTWTDFTQESTLHGLKYIFQPSSRLFRRALWLLALLTALTIFVAQVFMRGSAYFKYNTNVDVKVVYKTEVTFPAVTVCNQNSFRPLEVSTISSSSTPDDGPRKEKTAPPPKQKTQQGVSTWTDFTQESTLHGLKYIFQPSSRLFRRALWLLVLLTALTIFVAQVFMRGSAYFKYNTNVDVKVVYKTEVTFPAVTVCNQNSFRPLEVSTISSSSTPDDGPRKEKTAPPPKQKTQQGVSTWTDFTQESTLHGLKYIFQPSSRLFRRALWLLVLLTALTIFVAQVFMRGSAYFKYNTNVDVQVVYKTEVTFPAVTVCNQNSFRLTALADLKLYSFIEAVYSADNITDVDFSIYDLDGIDTETFLRKTSHQKNDLIESCYWKGKPCDVETDFVTVLTGLGVCYTFTSGTQESAWTVYEPGSRAGLRLTLNLEQYEFTSGPQSDAGVKLLLHGHSEYPMMDDLGFAAGAGAHTQVGVNTVKVDNLPEPYGTCNDEGVPMSECLSDCRTRQTIERCGCRAPYMRPLDEYPGEICGLEKLFSCAQRDHTIEKNSTAIVCHCSLPCERTTYEASLSYAQLSHFNIERKVLKDKTRRDAVWDRQYKAREMFQLVDQVAMKENENEYNELLTRTLDLEHVLRDMRGNFTDEHIMGKLQNVTDRLIQDHASVQQEYFRVYGLLDNHYRDMWGPIEMSTAFIAGLTSYLGIGSDSLVEEIRGCSAGNVTQRCIDATAVFQQYLYGGRQAYAGFQGVTASYVSTLADVYSNTPLTAPYVDEHQQCLTGLHNVTSSIVILSDVILAMNNIQRTATPDGYLQAIDILTSLVVKSDFENFATLMVDTVYDCKWIVRVSVGWIDAAVGAIDKMENDADNSQLIHTTINTFLLPALSATEDLVYDSVLPIVDATELYMNGHIWKLELYNKLQNAVYRRASDAIDAAVIHLLEQFHSVMIKLELLELEIPKTFQRLLNLVIPVVRDEQLEKSTFFGLSGLSNATEALKDSLRDPAYSAAPILADVTHQVISEVADPIDELHSGLRVMTDELATALLRQQNRLYTFAEDIKINDAFYMSNFLTVDIYYKELKYDQITQFPAFEVLSLLGEVGGFLGLLLGASVLTLIELLDGVAMIMYHRLRRSEGATKQTAEA